MRRSCAVQPRLEHAAQVTRACREVNFPLLYSNPRTARVIRLIVTYHSNCVYAIAGHLGTRMGHGRKFPRSYSSSKPSQSIEDENEDEGTVHGKRFRARSDCPGSALAVRSAARRGRRALRILERDRSLGRSSLDSFGISTLLETPMSVPIRCALARWTGSRPSKPIQFIEDENEDENGDGDQGLAQGEISPK